MENAMRAQLVRAVLTENMEGRGPCFMDCRHLPEETIELIYRGIANEKPPLIEYLKKRDIDLKKDMFEVQAFGLHGRRNGPLVNERMESSIPGLYAAGDCAGFGSGVSGGGESAASGLIAGDCAAEYSAGAEPPVIDEKQVAENLELIERYSTEGGIKPQEFEAKLARTMSDYVGHTRNRSGLLVAQKRLGLFKADLEKLSAENPRELWWAFESRNLFEIARLVTFFALEREESRSYHLRADFPEKNDEKWGKIMIARLDGNDIKYRTIPMPTRG
jgi:adenylylsulfate reductase subunit A